MSATATYTRIYRRTGGGFYEAPACRRCKQQLPAGETEQQCPACRPCDGCLAEPGEPCHPGCLSEVEQPEPLSLPSLPQR